mmetsp:Transcript_21314/g.66852  ORF Transcript_21314/g.66852 Transcript_21314/m.66852 type:complete len:916 (+) Transcript_21314:156-2903(+)
MGAKKTMEQLRFREKLQDALDRAGEVLESSIRPVKVESVAHAYSDKFVVAESASRLCAEAMAAVLEGELKVPAAKQREAGSCLKFDSREWCEYSRETQREVKGPKTTFTSEQSGKFYGTSKHKVTTETTTQVTEHEWRHGFGYKLSLVRRSDHSVVETLVEAEREHTLRTVSKETPPKQAKVNAPEVLDLKALDAAAAIDRSKASCKTPRRNEEIETCLAAFASIQQFAHRVARLFPGATGKPAAAQFTPTKTPFSPPACVALDASECRPFSPSDREALIAEMRRSFDELASCAVEPAESLLGPEEVRLRFALWLLETLSNDYAGAVNYLESLLYDQLSAAIGKELTPEAFADYVVYHERRLFAPEFRPSQFAFAVRRSADSFPDGELRLAVRGKSETARTMCRRVETRSEMRFAHGATTFRFDGEKWAHAYVARTFARGAPAPLELTARARQFSSFLVMVGTLVGPDEFAPEHAVVVKNKDEVIIPLLLEPIPTPKEFADAIESLSPEQRAFCEAFRQMQLASTLFAVLVVQLKPQVEKVLNLDPGALTKEIQLTETLMDLFIEYQIPTSMLSYDGPTTASPDAKIDAVKAHAAQIQTMIDDARKRDLELTAQEAVHRKLADDYSIDEDFDENSIQCVKEEALFGAAESFGGGGGDKNRKKKCAMPRSSQLLSAKPARARGFGGAARQQQAPIMAASFSMCAANVPPPVPTGVPAATPVEPTSAGGAVPVEPQLPADDDWNEVGSDLTSLPKRLDENFKVLDTDSQLRPTTIKPQTPWMKRYKKSILAEPATVSLDQPALDRERARAFDLLDALTRSGALPLESTSLHVLVAATHAFDRTITDTLVVDNVDVVVKAERASLIIASTLFDRPCADLVLPDKLAHIAQTSPNLLPPPAQDHDDGRSDDVPTADEAS